MKIQPFISCLVVALIEFGGTTVNGQMTATVTVNCSHGQSINQALNQHPNAKSLIVEISGMCRENVVVTRDRVTLRGMDPANDGIQAVSNTETIDAALWVRGAQLVTVENLKLTGGYSGLTATAASDPVLKVINCRVESNAAYGVRLEGNSLLQAENTVINSNGNLNVAAFGGSNFRGQGCTISDPLGNGPLGPAFKNNVLVSGSFLGLLQSTLANGGIQSTDSSLSVSDTTINASVGGVSILANGQSFGTLMRLQISGPLRFSQGTNLTLLGVTQTSNGTGNTLDDNAYVKIADASPATGGSPNIPSVIFGLDLSNFSDASVRQTSQINGNLSCNSGANAFCANPANVSGTSSCGLCPKP